MNRAVQWTRELKRENKKTQRNDAFTAADSHFGRSINIRVIQVYIAVSNIEPVCMGDLLAAESKQIHKGKIGLLKLSTRLEH